MSSARDPRSPVETAGSDVAPVAPSEAESIGARIAAARRARGLNRNQLARELGTSWGLVNRWEKNRTVPSSASFRSLARILGVTVQQLRGASGSPEEAYSKGLADFVRSHAPPDLTEDELRWLGTLHETFGHLTAADYVELLCSLRRPSKR